LAVALLSIFELLSVTGKSFVEVIPIVGFSQLSVSSVLLELFELLVSQILNLFLVESIFHTHGNLMIQLLFGLDLNNFFLSKSSLILEADEVLSVSSKVLVVHFLVIFVFIQMTGCHGS
jgi:hypothetical protein